MAEAMNSIVEWNRNLRRQAAALNARAGSVVFLVETFAELVARLKGLLAGATSIAAVKDPESLRLPELDPELVQLVIADAPDTVLVGSVSVPVEYREGHAPLIRFPSQLGDLWRELPAQSLLLPGGREVAVCSQVNSWSYSQPTTDLAAFRCQIAQVRATSDFERWEKPMLEIPDFRAEGVSVPPLQEQVYGFNAVDNSPLIAFGTIVEYYGGYSPQWYRDRQEAQAARERTVQAATAAQAETKRLRLEAEAASKLNQQLAAGEALANFEAWHRRGGATNNGEGWVVRADGSLRPHDGDDVRRHKSDGNYRWNFVSPDELALRWSCDNISDVDGNSKFEVAKLPVGGCTSAQLQAVQAIEGEIGASVGMFGLDPEANARQEQLLNDIRAAVAKTPGGKSLEWERESLKQACGTNGRMVEEDHIYRLIRKGVEFEASCHGRDAQVVRTYPVGKDGVVEALAFEKFGVWNLSLRYRKLLEGETLPAPELEPEVPSGLTGLFGGQATFVPKKRR